MCKKCIKSSLQIAWSRFWFDVDVDLIRIYWCSLRLTAWSQLQWSDKNFHLLYQILFQVFSAALTTRPIGVSWIWLTDCHLLSDSIISHLWRLNHSATCKSVDLISYFVCCFCFLSTYQILSSALASPPAAFYRSDKLTDNNWYITKLGVHIHKY